MNEVIAGDNLSVMGGMDGGTVDLIYLDPPFGTGKDWDAYVDKRTATNTWLGSSRA